jgi:hypothetical protein
MATSGTYTFTVTRDDIIREAMLNVVQLGDNEVPSATENSDCARKLNMMVKQWMGTTDFAPGLKVWTRRHADLLLSSTKGSYNLGPSGDNWTTNLQQAQTSAPSSSGSGSITVLNASTSGVFPMTCTILIQTVLADLFQTQVAGTIGNTVLLPVALPANVSTGAYVYTYTSKAQRPEKLETLYLRDSLYNDTPMRIITSEEYDYLPNKQQPGYTGDPIYGYYENQLINGVLYIDVAGAADTTKRIRSTYLEPIQDFDNPLDNPEYPASWYNALCWGLSKQIAPMFERPFSKDMQDNFDMALAMAREGDPTNNTTLFFQPGLE